MIHVMITQEDIDLGLKSNCLSCPIARACKRIPELLDVAVSHGTVRSFATGNSYALPVKAQNWVELFDGGCKMLPLEFDLGEPVVYGNKGAPVVRQQIGGDL
jgi:hypothetical protein